MQYFTRDDFSLRNFKKYYDTEIHGDKMRKLLSAVGNALAGKKTYNPGKNDYPRMPTYKDVLNKKGQWWREAINTKGKRPYVKPSNSKGNWDDVLRGIKKKRKISTNSKYQKYQKLNAKNRAQKSKFSIGHSNNWKITRYSKNKGRKVHKLK